MAETDQDQKTEQPSEKRLREAMDRGQFARAPELSIALTIAAVLGVLAFTTQSASRLISEYSIAMFTRFGATAVSRDTIQSELSGVLLTTAHAASPFLIACVGAALLAGGLQSGFQLTPEAVMFKVENLNPTAGFKRIFSRGVFVKAGIDILKLVAIGGVLFVGAKSLMADALFSAPVEAAYLGEFISHATMVFLGRLLFALSLVAAVSYGYEKFKTGRELKMTREELKEERRNAEGDANAKAAMRRMARRLMQKQMLSAVATADVVIVNPTHFAVALKYERGKDQAPVVLAKGENRFALRIKALAAENGVPVVENKPIARLLFAMGEVGETIPANLYQAVAEILAVVYRTHRYYFHRLKTRRMEAGA
ncbi:MAG: type secretion exporter [Verrucomicrobia bacterium]|nr:type secretion exporter [Verrucomicrobiota bacterium]